MVETSSQSVAQPSRSALGAALRAAWSERMALSIDDCRRSVAQIKARPDRDAQAEYELRLLDASLARADQDMARSGALLADARRVQIEQNLPVHFQQDFRKPIMFI